MVSSGEIPAVIAAVHCSGYLQAFLTPLPPKNLSGTSFTSVPTAVVDDFCAFISHGSSHNLLCPDLLNHCPAGRAQSFTEVFLLA